MRNNSHKCVHGKIACVKHIFCNHHLNKKYEVNKKDAVNKKDVNFVHGILLPRSLYRVGFFKHEALPALYEIKKIKNLHNIELHLAGPSIPYLCVISYSVILLKVAAYTMNITSFSSHIETQKTIKPLV